MVNRVLYLASNMCTDKHPGNTLTAFTNTFPAPLTLRGVGGIRGLQCCAALQLLQFNASFINTPKSLDEDPHPHLFLCPYPAYMTMRHQGLLEPFRNHCRKLSIPTNACYSPDDIANLLNALCTGSGLHFSIQGGAIQINGSNVVLFLRPCIVDFLHLRAHAFAVFLDPDTGAKYYKLFFQPGGDYMLASAPPSFEDSSPKYIRVTLDELQQSATTEGGGSSTGTTLAIVPYVKASPDSSSYHLQQRGRYYVPLSHSRLDSLQVKLLDESRQQLRVAAGQPTVVKMSLQMRGSEFVVHLSSRRSNVRGTNSDFRWYPDPPLQLAPRRWKVALSSMFFPSQFLVYSELDVVSMTRAPFTILRGVPGSETKYGIDTHQEVLESSHRLVDELQTQATGLMTGVTIVLQHGRVVIDQEDGHLQPAFLDLDSKLAYILGLTGLYRAGERVRLSLDSPVVGMAEVNVRRLCPELITVSSDLIEPVIYGSGREPVLEKVAGYRGKSMGKLQHYTVEHPTFHLLSHSLISCVRFQLTQEDGQQVEFADKEEEVLLTLVFRKKAIRRRRRS